MSEEGSCQFSSAAGCDRCPEHQLPPSEADDVQLGQFSSPSQNAPFETNKLAHPMTPRRLRVFAVSRVGIESMQSSASEALLFPRPEGNRV